MTVRLHKNRWIADVQVRGRRVRRRSPINSELGARVFEQALRQQLEDGDPLFGRRSEMPSVASWAREWMANECTLLDHSATGIRTKETILRLHLLPFFGSMRLDTVDSRTIKRFVSEQHRKGLAAKTINNHLAVLGRLLRAAEEDGLLDAVPKIKKRKTTSPDLKFYNEVEVEQLLSDNKEPVLNLMVRTGLRTGMRKGEIAALEWDCVRFDDNVIRVSRNIVHGVVGVPKSKKPRTIPMSRDFRDMLRTHRRSGGLVFRRSARAVQHGKSRYSTEYITNEMMTKGIMRLCRRVGVRYLGWHALRHTFATQLIRRGVDVHQVCALLGHSSITVTEKYLHVQGTTLQGTVDTLLEPAELHGTGSWHLHPERVSEPRLAMPPQQRWRLPGGRQGRRDVGTY